MMTELGATTCDTVSTMFPAQRWRSLASLVRSYCPDVVVLVARKMPRLAECLSLDFGSADLISDLAIPYAAAELRSKRVAIVDDVVNVGSTLQAALGKVRAGGAREVQLFALARREGPKSLDESLLSCADSRVYSHSEMREFSQQVPEALRLTSKPYDLEFPIIPCKLAAPYRDVAELASFLRSEFGHDAVFDLSHTIARDRGLFRLTVVLADKARSNRKLRFYVNERDGSCMVVPFFIPTDSTVLKNGILACQALSLVWSRTREHVAAISAETETIPGESAYRLQLYLVSWAAGLWLLHGQLAPVLQLADGEPLSFVDAEMLFGHGIRSILEELDVGAVLHTRQECEQAIAAGQKDSRHSPFASRCSRAYSLEFIRTVRERAHSSGLHDLFLEFFGQFAELTGAEDPGRYELDWPYRKATIEQNPYLRLRVGPTFDDLCMFFEMASQHLPDVALATPRELSALLDWTIDEGTVVPTTAGYDGKCYRVYRKGESRSRDKALDRLAYALKTLPDECATSRTRTAKILATLSFSRRVPRTTFPGAISRGNVGVFPTNCLDADDTEITQYARNIGRIRFL